MQNLTKATTLALMLAAVPLWAQDAAPETPAGDPPAATEAQPGAQPPADEAPAGETPATEEPAAEGEATPPASAPGLSMGEPEGGSADGQQPGDTYLKTAHGDWELRCVNTGDDQPDPCQLYQLLEDGNGNSVAEFNLFALPAGGQAKAGANIVTPLETLLTEQITISVDGAQGKRYPFTFCTQIGCVSRVGFTEADINGFKAGNSARLTLVPAGAPDQKVQLTISLKGFTAGFTALEAERAAAGN